MAALGGLGLAAFRLSAQPAEAAKAARPNIIFLLADDYGIAGMGCYGGVYKTPNLDTLAAAGTRFEYYMKDAPWWEIPVPSDTPDARAKAARARLRTVLDGLLAQDTGQPATPAKDSRKQEKLAKRRKQRQAVP